MLRRVHAAFVLFIKIIMLRCTHDVHCIACESCCAVWSDPVEKQSNILISPGTAIHECLGKNVVYTLKTHVCVAESKYPSKTSRMASHKTCGVMYKIARKR